MNPDIVSLQAGEEIRMVVRRHWFSLAIEGALAAFILLLIAFFIVGFDSFILLGSNGVSAAKVVSTGFFFFGFVGLLLWMHFFARWSDHWLDAWVITNKRVIDIEQFGFFRREVSSFELSSIQDVTYTISGIIPTWLHFGDVRMQTASVSQNLVMRQIAFPEEVKEYLITLIGKEKTER